MNKYIKTGLRMAEAALSTTVCALTLAYGQSATIEKQQEAKPYSLEEVWEVENEYNKKFNKAIADNKLSVEEIQELNDYLNQHIPSIQKYNQQASKENLGEKISFKEDYSKSIENKVLEDYPGLVDKKVNVFYDADKLIEKEYGAFLNSIVKEIKEYFKGKENFENLREKENWTIKDLTKFYLFLQSKGNKKENKNQRLKNKIDLVRLEGHQEWYKAYLERISEAKKLANEYFSGSLLLKNKCENIIKKSKDELEIVLNIETKRNINLENQGESIALLENKIPLWAWLPVMGLGAIFSQFLMTRYTRRKLDGFDGISQGVLSPVFGILFFDGLFPWAMPIRIIGIPLIIEFLRKFDSNSEY